VVLPSRATSAKTVQQRKGRGTEQEKSVQREKKKRKINKYHFTNTCCNERKRKQLGVIEPFCFVFLPNLMTTLGVFSAVK